MLGVIDIVGVKLGVILTLGVTENDGVVLGVLLGVKEAGTEETVMLGVLDGLTVGVKKGVIEIVGLGVGLGNID
jgi:hypothetical protein